jgi:hypothetical protein
MKAKKVKTKPAWIRIDKCVPPKESGFLLVTNNIGARDAFGHMSHIWLVSLIFPQFAGGFSAYAEPSDRRVENLTHWRPAIPEEWKPEKSIAARYKSCVREMPQ